MKITIVGSGYVGLVSGACFAEFGIDTVCVDKDAVKIENLKKGIIPIFEPGLETLVENNTREGRLSFTTDLKEGLKDTDAVFIAVGTPTLKDLNNKKADGHADLQYVYAVAEEIATHLDHYAVVVTKSTVPVGTAAEIKKIIRDKNPSLEFDVCSNPEFLREGSAINDFMKPDRVVIGVETERAEQIMRRLYRPIFLHDTPVVITNPESSELTKYAANAFLATKITFINEIANLCEQCGADVATVAQGMGLDNRIGPKFLNTSPGYGGSCFPKDTLALTKTGDKFDVEMSIVKAVIESNTTRKKDMATRIVNAFGGSVKGKTMAVLGLTFKANTDDMRDSASLDIIPALMEAGATVKAYDPEGMHEAQKLMPDVDYQKSSEACLKDADAAIILTEWDVFKTYDLKHMASLLKTPMLFDLRNLHTPDAAEAAGLDYYSLGRGVYEKTKKTSAQKAA